MQSEAPSRRQRLREATQSQHADLDGVIENARYFDSLAGYSTWLQGGYRFNHAVTRDLVHRGFGAQVARTSLLLRTELLRQDLADLGVTAVVKLDEIAPGPRDLAEALGVLYVTEGASLGARVLLLRARALGLSAARGARQLAHSANDLQTWRDLVSVLDGAVCTCEDEDRIVDAARRTFAVALAHLTQPTYPDNKSRPL